MKTSGLNVYKGTIFCAIYDGKSYSAVKEFLTMTVSVRYFVVANLAGGFTTMVQRISKGSFRDSSVIFSAFTGYSSTTVRVSSVLHTKYFFGKWVNTIR
ncbi:MAG: hypothetical protein LBV41_03330 [Cytophagaceae bacterium]|jgi:hypothetical protein|nr:hypothetical protein [Cytophagaceae bacterium]